MQLLFLKIIGSVVARAPERLLAAASALLGDGLFLCARRRRRLVLSNLHHAFPEKPSAWHRAVGRESCRRLIETGFLSLATPYLRAARYREMIQASPELLACYAAHAARPRPTLLCSPHLAYWEAQTAMPLVIPGRFPEFGIIYRPLDHPAADAFVKSSRERFGMKLLSRKDGFASALKILRRDGFVGVLFDQNAGMQGALTTLFGRVCSTTELPGLMAERYDAVVYGIFPRRLGFWRVALSAERIAHDGNRESVTVALNRWLEELLRRDVNLCASWLWAHDRWRHQDIPVKRLHLESRRDLLATELALRQREALPRRTRIWVRLPNWLGDVVMAVPLLRAIRGSRPDAEITLWGKSQFVALLETWGIADRVRPLPPAGVGYFRHFWKLRSEYPDTWLLFTNSLRGDLEAWLTGVKQRFGIRRRGKPRPLLTHAYRLSGDYDERAHHQLELWESFLSHFGLTAPPDRRPRDGAAFNPPAEARIALIAGSENNPEKRWPVAHWRALINALPDERFTLLGTANDLPITTAIAHGYAEDHVINFAGRTDLARFAEMLAASRILVTNDTGGMHLANALGVHLVALFGPTNPVRTGPVFDAPFTVLQPPGCAPTGGGSLADLRPEVVAEAVRGLLRASASSVDRLPR